VINTKNFSHQREGKSMFNSSSVFNRNDPVTRRDTPPPVLGSGTADRNNAVRSGSEHSSPAQAVRPTSGQKTAAENSSASVSATPAKSPEPVATAAETDSTTSEKAVGARLIVGPDVKLKGAEILDCDTLVVEGRVEATMDSRVIRIAEKGSFSGKVSIDIAEIHGTFEGELTARSQLIIHATGRVSGSIRFGKLVVDEGGELCGEINVLSENAAAKARPAVVEPLVARSVAVNA
jgi:cytoskeletal protein CcmA (bactofilin family)